MAEQSNHNTEPRVEVYVATHKKIDFAIPDYCKKIQVNAERNGQWEGYLHDNDNPDNISLKNPNYCELTALYAMWKNCDADIQGLCHYRRYFSNVEVLAEDKVTYGYGNIAVNSSEIKDMTVSEQEITETLRDNDVICRDVHLFPMKVMDFFKKFCFQKDINELCGLLKRDYPDYFPAMINLLNGSRMSTCNMFIAKRDFVNGYCMWLFDVLGKIENIISIEGYNSQRARVFGYMSELLLNVYIKTHKLKCRYRYSVCAEDHMNTDKNIIKRTLKSIPGLVKTVRAVLRIMNKKFYREDDYCKIHTARIALRDAIVIFTPKNWDVFSMNMFNLLMTSINENTEKIQAEFMHRNITVMPCIALCTEIPASIRNAFIESGISVIEYN